MRCPRHGIYAGLMVRELEERRARLPDVEDDEAALVEAHRRDVVWVRPRAATVLNQGSRALFAQPTYRGSFSAVSKPIFVSRYAFCIFRVIFQNLKDFRTSSPFRAQNYQNVTMY